MVLEEQYPHAIADMTLHAQAAADLLKQLAHPARLMILCSLAHDELSVSQINNKITLSQSALSQHLASLRQADLVRCRKVGQSVFYRLQGSEASQIIQVLQRIYCPEHFSQASSGEKIYDDSNN